MTYYYNISELKGLLDTLDQEQLEWHIRQLYGSVPMTELTRSDVEHIIRNASGWDNSLLSATLQYELAMRDKKDADDAPM